MRIVIPLLKLSNTNTRSFDIKALKLMYTNLQNIKINRKIMTIDFRKHVNMYYAYSKVK